MPSPPALDDQTHTALGLLKRTVSRECLGPRSRRPQEFQGELDGIERLELNPGVIGMGSEQSIAVAIESKDLDRANIRIHQPDMSDSAPSIDGQLGGPVEGFGRGRENFGNPVGCQRGVRLVGELGHSFSAPRGEVGDENIAVEVELRFVQEDPASGSAPPSAKRRAQFFAECRGDRRMTQSWPWMGVHRTGHELGDEVPWGGENVFVGRQPSLAHDSQSLPWPTPISSGRRLGHERAGLRAGSRWNRLKEGDGASWRARPWRWAGAWWQARGGLPSLSPTDRAGRGKVWRGGVAPEEQLRTRSSPRVPQRSRDAQVALHIFVNPGGDAQAVVFEIRQVVEVEVQRGDSVAR